MYEALPEILNATTLKEANSLRISATCKRIKHERLIADAGCVQYKHYKTLRLVCLHTIPTRGTEFVLQAKVGSSASSYRADKLIVGMNVSGGIMSSVFLWTDLVARSIRQTVQCQVIG
jgi:hypothetical protein